jgi:hypothetical protein
MNGSWGEESVMVSGEATLVVEGTNAPTLR